LTDVGDGDSRGPDRVALRQRQVHLPGKISGLCAEPSSGSGDPRLSGGRGGGSGARRVPILNSGTGLYKQLNNRPEHCGMGCGGVFGRIAGQQVRFHKDVIAGPDEACCSANEIHGAPNGAEDSRFVVVFTPHKRNRASHATSGGGSTPEFAPGRQ